MRDVMGDYARQYEIVARAIEFSRNNARHQPKLNEIADNLGLSEFISKEPPKWQEFGQKILTVHVKEVCLRYGMSYFHLLSKYASYEKLLKIAQNLLDEKSAFQIS